MKFVLVFLYVAAMAAAEEYAGVGEGFDVAEVLENERLLNSYVKCLLHKGPCTPEIKAARDILPEALETRCAKCSDRQKQLGKTLAREVSKKHPEKWAELIKHYDPTGKHQEAFQDYLKD